MNPNDMWDTGLYEKLPRILKNMAKEEVIVTHKTAKEIDAVELIEGMMEGVPEEVMEKWRNGQAAFIYPSLPTGPVVIVNLQ